MFPLVYFAFDLLFLDGKDLREQRLSARRELLAKLLEKAPENIRFSGELRGSKDGLLRVDQEFGFEGLAGRQKIKFTLRKRSTQRAWVKFKITKSQEFVIGGYTLPEGSRSHFGSLLVGYQSPEGLMLAGRIGTGFSDKVLASLYTKFQKLKVPSSPFVNLPEKSQGKWGLGITARGHETGASGLNLYWSFQKEFALTNSSRKPSWLISNIYVTTRISFNGRWMIRTIA